MKSRNWTCLLLILNSMFLSSVSGATDRFNYVRSISDASTEKTRSKTEVLRQKIQTVLQGKTWTGLDAGIVGYDANQWKVKLDGRILRVQNAALNFNINIDVIEETLGFTKEGDDHIAADFLNQASVSGQETSHLRPYTPTPFVKVYSYVTFRMTVPAGNPAIFVTLDVDRSFDPVGRDRIDQSKYEFYLR